MKLLFPPLWTVLSAVPMMTGGGYRASAHPPTMELIPFLFWCLGMAAMRWMCIPLKRVRRDGINLYISNYFREIRVPLAAVGEVAENRWIDHHPVTIRFRRPTGFGERITFMPKARVFELEQPSGRGGAAPGRGAAPSLRRR